MLIDETIHQYKGKRSHFWKYALFQYFFRRSVRLRGQYFVIHNHWCPGYYHWITEALPRLLHCSDVVANRTLVLPESFKDKLYESIKPLFTGEVFWIPQNKNLVIENLLIPETPPFSGVYDKDTFIQLRQLYTERFKVPSGTMKKGSRIYVSRAKAKQRKVANEIELSSLLKKYNFSIIHFEEYTFWQQVAIMQEASCLVSIHGAGLSNILFARKDCHIIELQKAPISPDDEVDVLYKDFSALMGHPYTLQLCKPVQHTQSLYQADIIVDLEQLSTLLPFAINQE